MVTIFTFISFSKSFGQQGYIEDIGTSLWEENNFIDSLESENEESAEEIPELETGSGDYISEEEITEQIQQEQKEDSKINFGAAIEESKQNLKSNLIYGAATGLLIGGWYTLIQPGDSRSNLRNLGAGAVLGTLLGLAIGTKKIYVEPKGNLTSGLDSSKQLFQNGLQLTLKYKF